jgi:hypothetical protein
VPSVFGPQIRVFSACKLVLRVALLRAVVVML